MKNPDIQCECRTIDNGVLVTVRGEVDYSNSPNLRIALLKALEGDRQRVVVDLSKVPYLDSSGLATLVEALQVQRQRNAELVLCGLQPKVTGIINIAKLNSLFVIVEDADTAIEA